MSSAIVSDIQALESMKDPGHIMNLYSCIGQECPDCPLNFGMMDGGCCRGLKRAARRHYDMYRAGLCDLKALTKRYATLASFLRRKAYEEALKNPASFLPPCRHRKPNNNMTWCYNRGSKYYGGPCSKRCKDSVQ
ncbi:MAG: hypothetical protein KAS32_24330 [Candidatus Peribacteraceae bacterium]|nr:hypothetical protein [Candidatus Peribacteraceae bacterium]